jgi:hypothetical protein
VLSIAIDSQADQIQHTDNGFIPRARVSLQALTTRKAPPILPVRSPAGIDYFCKEHNPSQTKRERIIETPSAGEVNMKITVMSIFKALLGVFLTLVFLAPPAGATVLK